MLVIRLFRTGKKNQPSFKIVITDKRKSSKGRGFIEDVGFYNPLTKQKNLKTDRIKYWVSIGAQPSDTVYNLLIKEKIIEGKKIPVHKKAKKEAKKNQETSAVESVTAEKPTEETKKEELPKEEAPKTE